MAPCPAPSRLPSESTTSPVSRTCLNRRRSSRDLLRRLLAEQLRDAAPALAAGRVVAQLDADLGAAVGRGAVEAHRARVADVAAVERAPGDQLVRAGPRRSRRPIRPSDRPAPWPPSASGRRPLGTDALRCSMNRGRFSKSRQN